MKHVMAPWHSMKARDGSVGGFNARLFRQPVDHTLNAVLIDTALGFVRQEWK
jgi:hypothetical protein